MFPSSWQSGEPVEGRADSRSLAWTERVLLWISRTFPPDPRQTIFFSLEGRAEREYEEELEFPFHAYFEAGPEMFVGKKMLDIGSGVGASAARYREWGALSVTGVEVGLEKCHAAEDFADSKGLTHIWFVNGAGERLPLESNSFDLLTMFDVMEHVVSPCEVLRECYRVLKPGGIAAMVFPPYYYLSGGSHLHGYFTSFPGLNLLFTTATLRSAASMRLREQGIDYWRYLRQVPSDKLWGQNGLTASRFKRLLRESDFGVHEMRYVGMHDHRLPPRTRKKRVLRPLYWPFETAAKTPLLQEAMCVRIAALLRKE